MTPVDLIPHLVAAMTAVAPPQRLANAPAFPGWQESADERQARYVGIAGAAIAIAFDPAEQPLFAGPHGRKRTASLLLAIAFFESGYSRDVDLGPCYPQTDPKTHVRRCDGGASACLLQIKVGDGTTAEGYTRADLFADREKCFRAGLHKARSSFNACGPRYGMDGALNAYTSGDCGAGQAAGAARLEVGRKFFKRAFVGVVPSDWELLRVASSGA